MIPDEIAKTIQELKDEGLIEWTGEFKQDTDGIPRKTYAIAPKGIIALTLLQKAGYGAAMDDGWGEPGHIEKAVLAERERIVGIITEYYKVAPKAAEPLLRLIKGDVDEAHRT